MTDLLNTQATDQAADGGVATATDARTFRAATLDEAVAAAREAFGRDVELREAHRVRRGGLGGFFATDLGVEIVAAPTPPTAKEKLISSSLDLAPDEPFPAPATRRVQRAWVGGLERLIDDAEASDRMNDVRATTDRSVADMDLDERWARALETPMAPYDYADDTDLDPAPHPFATAIETELAAATDAATTETPRPRRIQRFDDAPTLPDADAPARVDLLGDDAPRLPSRLTTPPIGRVVEMDDVAETDENTSAADPEPAAAEALAADEMMADDMMADAATSDVPAAEELRLPDVPLAAKVRSVPNEAPQDEAIENEALQDDLAQHSMPRPLMPVLTLPEPAAPSAPLPPPTTLGTASSLTANELIASIFNLGEHGERSFSRISVNVTTDDGTTMSVAADFSGTDDE